MDIKNFITEHIVNHPADIVKFTMLHFKISRPAVHKHLRVLLNEGRITARGKTRARFYALVGNSQPTNMFCFPGSLEPEVGERLLRIELTISRNALPEFDAVFEQYTNLNKNSGLLKTRVTAELSELFGETYISRSQAKRILVGLEKFQEIVLDFKKVTTVGQGFVDEVFCIFRNAHPEIQITWVNPNENVLFMLERGLTG